MVTVRIPPLLRSQTGGVAVVEVPGATVGEVIEQLEQQFPGISARLVEGDLLRAGLNVSIGSRVYGRMLQQPVPPGSEVQFLSAVAGG
jgi:molybdopterin converting factor small subunit